MSIYHAGIVLRTLEGLGASVRQLIRTSEELSRRLAHDLLTYELARRSPAAWLRAPEFSCKLASLLRKDSIVAG